MHVSGKRMSEQRFQWTPKPYKSCAVVVYNTLPVARTTASVVTINFICIKESIESDMLVDRTLLGNTKHQIVLGG